MELNDIDTLADAQQYITENTPKPVCKWYGIKCPRCQQRFYNSLFGTWMNYETHYANHLIDDIQSGIV